MAASLPDWVMLDRFVFRRDDAGSFPDDETAPVRASASTSRDSPFSVAFRLAEPPAISRLYVQWPRGPKPEEGQTCSLVAAHRNLVLFRLDDVERLDEDPYLAYHQDHFICRASSSSCSPPLLLKRIPTCTEPLVLGVKKGKVITMPHPFYVRTVGILCRGEEEFAVAQLDMVSQIPGSRNLEAQLCVLRSRVSDDHGTWKVKQLPVHHVQDESFDLYYWSTDAVIPFENYICWVDYYRGGILFYEAFEERPEISYLRLPIDDRPSNSAQRKAFYEFNRGVCVTKAGHVLKFVDVARGDGRLFGRLKPGSGFTVTSHTLSRAENGDMGWEKDYVITSGELWDLNACLPRDILMFPLVSMDEPHVVHFLFSEPADEIDEEPTDEIDEELAYKIDKVSVVTIDLSTKRVVSIVPYIEGEEDLRGEDADMVMEKSHLLKSFLPSGFPKFLNFKRKRKNEG